MFTGIMIYEAEDCSVLTETMQSIKFSHIDDAFKAILDRENGALIQVTYVDPDDYTITNSERFSA